MNNFLIVNFDRKEFLLPADFGEAATFEAVADSYDGILMALAVLLASGNNRGGGDLRSDHPYIGCWAGSRIALIDDVVCDSAFSSPGQEDVPLYEQVLSSYTNVSVPAIEAIVDGEGGGTILSILSDYLVIPKPIQRDLPGEGLTFYSRETFDTKHFVKLDDLFNVFGQTPGFTGKTCAPRLQAGLKFFAELHGRPERYTVESVELLRGQKVVETQWRSTRIDERGVVGLQAQLIDDTSGNSVTLKVQLGDKQTASTFKSVLDTVFPGVSVFKAAATEPAQGGALIEGLVAQLKK